MANQFIIAENTGADRDHLGAYASSRPDILRRITNEADGGIVPESAPCLGHALPEDVDPHFVMIAKTPKAEELSQTGGSDFVPAYRFQISGSHTQQFSGSL